MLDFDELLELDNGSVPFGLRLDSTGSMLSEALVVLAKLKKGLGLARLSLSDAQAVEEWLAEYNE